MTEVNNTPEDDKVEKQKKHDAESAADLEKVTDFAEEKEISGTDLTSLLANLGTERQKKKILQLEREKELAKVPIKKEDVELIINELEVTKQNAERTLRENGGNLVAALTALVKA
uniref:huntingtin-interacting protein K-like n=1 Tax=Styela clava TaxID=7725 RepID=UPI0019397851|nr:huntingtin-interacting protein K-like [Styela clava]